MLQSISPLCITYSVKSKASSSHTMPLWSVGSGFLILISYIISPPWYNWNTLEIVQNINKHTYIIYTHRVFRYLYIFIYVCIIYEEVIAKLGKRQSKTNIEILTFFTLQKIHFFTFLFLCSLFHKYFNPNRVELLRNTITFTWKSVIYIHLLDLRKQFYNRAFIYTYILETHI